MQQMLRNKGNTAILTLGRRFASILLIILGMLLLIGGVVSWANTLGDLATSLVPLGIGLACIALGVTVRPR